MRRSQRPVRLSPHCRRCRRRLDGSAVPRVQRPAHLLRWPHSCSDNLRGFFEQCFPTLLKRLFGYDGPSWLNLVARVR